jgi:hypothetical protein
MLPCGDHAIFEDVVCPHVICPPILEKGLERKQKLVSESHDFTHGEKLLEDDGVRYQDLCNRCAVTARIGSMVRPGP